jgi:Cft2 family RNA processing exonuclease
LRFAKTGDSISLDPAEPPQTLRCHTEQFQFSAHASRESLIAYAAKVGPKKILLVHGDPPAVEWMRARLAGELPNCDVIVPTPGLKFEL